MSRQETPWEGRLAPHKRGSDALCWRDAKRDALLPAALAVPPCLCRLLNPYLLHAPRLRPRVSAEDQGSIRGPWAIHACGSTTALVRNWSEGAELSGFAMVSTGSGRAGRCFFALGAGEPVTRQGQGPHPQRRRIVEEAREPHLGVICRDGWTLHRIRR